MSSSLLKKFALQILTVMLLVTTIAPPEVAAVFSSGLSASSGSSGKDGPTYDLVAILVDEDVYNDEKDYEGLQNAAEDYDDLDEDDLKDRIERYAEDVQKSLTATKTLIIPVQKNEDTAWQLQRILERLYFEGDPESDERTQLRGVVLVGDVPIPVVNKNGNRFLSLFPYTDFTDKNYIWNPKTQMFEFQSSAATSQAEVWHGVIRPPASGLANDAVVAGNSTSANTVLAHEQLATYFDKNHLYHIGNTEFSEFRKKILMSDLVREQKNINSAKFSMYENFLKNSEDLAYNRYTDQWLQELQKNFNEDFSNLLKEVSGGGSAGNSVAASGDNLSKGAAKFYPPGVIASQKKFVDDLKNGKLPKGMKDILSAPLIQKFHLPFVSLFGNYLSKVNDFVASTGRWQTTDVDTVASLISKKDLFIQQFLLQTNNAIEAKIDEQIQKIQKPFSLLRGVNVQGRVGTDAIENVFFSNHSIIQDQQYVNGLASSAINSAQQCSLVSGTTQAVKSIRALNPQTMNFSPLVMKENLDPRRVPTFGVSTRLLSASEASQLTKGKFSFGILITSEFPKVGGTAQFQKGDILLSVDDKELNSGFSLEEAVQAHYPGRQVKNEQLVCNGFLQDSCDANQVQGWQAPFLPNPQQDNDFAKVKYFSAGGKERVKKAHILDLNNSGWHAGCSAANFSDPDKCFPLAASLPVNDLGGTQLVDGGAANAAGLNEAAGADACYNFYPFENFKNYYQSAQEGAANLKPQFPLLESKNVFFINFKDPLNPAKVTKFSLQDFYNHFSQMNGEDENGNYKDTNENGVRDQMAWNDANNNGKVDLCPANAPSSQAFMADKNAAIFPCTDGYYSGEFVGGDFGIDDPDEKKTLNQNFQDFAKNILKNAEKRLYSTPRKKPTNAERESVVNFLQKKELLNADSAGVANGSAEDAAESDQLRRDTSHMWFEFVPQVEKKISSVFEHKEPTAATLKAQFQSMMADYLPIDKPRFVSFQNASGNEMKLHYPNAFAIEDMNAFENSLKAAEKILGLSEGSLKKSFDSKALENALLWKNLDLNSKHQQALLEYLNPEIDAYVDDSKQGFEAWYFTANGGANEYNMNFDFSGSVTAVEEQDPVFQKILNGGVVVEGAAPAVKKSSGDGAALKEKPAEVPTGEQFYNEPIAIFEFPNKFPWFEAIQKWLKDIQKSFTPEEVSFADPEDANDVKNGNPASAKKDLKEGDIILSVESSMIKTGGNSETKVTARVSDGAFTEFTARIEGPGTILDLVDEDETKEGIQISLFGNLAFSVRSTAESGTITIFVNDQKIQILSRPDLFLHLEATEYSLPADGKSQTTLTATLADYDGPVEFSLAPLHDAGAQLGSFIGNVPTKMEKGKASVTLRSGTITGSAVVNIVVPGIDALSFPFLMLPTSAKRIVLSSDDMTPATSSSVNIQARLLDENDHVTFGNVPVTFKITGNSVPFGNFGENSVGENFSGAYKNEKSVSSLNGKANITLFTTEKSGEIHLIASAPGLENAILTLKTSATQSSNMALQLQPHVLYASLLGSDFGDVTEKDYFGGQVLFNGTTQAAASLLQKTDNARRIAFIQSDGKVDVIGSEVKLNVLSEHETQLFYEPDKKILGSVIDAKFIPSPDFAPQFELEPFFSGSSSASAKGWFVKNALEKLEANQRPGQSSTSLEDDQEGIGFVGENKHMLLLAAGNNVGMSHLPYASEIGVVLGDPTVKLKDTNVASQTGFTKDVGTEIFSGTSDIAFTAAIDLKGNQKKDLLVGYPNGEIRLLEQQAGNYRDRGVFLNIKNGISDAAVADIDNDGLEDLIVATQQGCTPEEVCTDLYRNKNGFLIRENIPLKVSKKVLFVRLKDMNLDGWTDMITSDDVGSVKIFYNQKGKFETAGQLLGNFKNPTMIMVGNTFPEVPKNEAPSVLAVPVNPQIASQDAQVTYFYPDAKIQGKYSYKQKNIEESKDVAVSSDDLKKDYPTDKKADGSVEAPPQNLTKQLSALTEEDSDHDGVPDAFDKANVSIGTAAGKGEKDKDFAASVADSVEDAVSAMRCSGGCLPMPLNFALFAPGPINVAGVPAGFDPGLPVFGWGATACAFWTFWPGCPFQSTVGGRLYLSPTATLGLGFSVCNGVYLAGQCYAFSIPTKPLLGQVCEETSGGFSKALENARSLSSGTGYDSVVAYGSGQNFSPPTGGFNKSVDLGDYSASVTGSKNIRVPGFPGFITEWLDGQIEEAMDKLGNLPDLYLIYPSLSSITGSVLPKIPSGELKGFTKFLAYLNSIPLIKIEPKEVEVRLPSLTRAQIQRFQNDVTQWKEDLKSELDRVKNLWTCFKTPDLKIAETQLCNKLGIDVEFALKNAEKLIQTLEEYKKFPKKLLDFRNVETKYLRQIINYLNAITNFTGGYIQRQQKRIEQWLDAAQKVKNILNNWQAFINISLEYEQSCDECKTDRFSLLQILMEIFVQIPAPPIIQFPKWPDIVMDFSKIQAGVTIIWPDIVFTPSPVILPKLPRVHFPDIYIPDFKLDFDLAAAIPDLPPPPELPQFPDLPPLKLFKLPDIPPAPKIPDMSAFPLLQESLSILKSVLEIVCLLKTGLVPVPESALKTEIEALTQRSVNPPLPIDLSITKESPTIQYKAMEKIKLESRMNFQLETNVIYNIVKGFADFANSLTVNMTETVNKATKKVDNISKATSYNPEIRLVAENSTEDFDAFADIEVGAAARDLQTSQNEYLPTLQKELTQYLAHREEKNRLLTSQPFGDVPLSRFVASTTESDQNYPRLPRLIADVPNNAANPIPASKSSSQSSYENALHNAADPVGILIRNPVTQKTERLMEFIAEIQRHPKVTYDDMDGDGDSDAFVVFGGDVYMKKNGLKNSNEKSYSGSPDTATIKDLLPVLPSVNNLRTNYSDNGSAGVDWSSSEYDNMAGYDVIYRSKNGATRKRYLFQDVAENAATENLQEKKDFEVSLIDRKTANLNFELENGNYYLQILPFDTNGIYGTVSETALMAPQVCGDTTEPILQIDGGTGASGTGNKKKVAILKTLNLKASDANSVNGITYFADTDLTKDDNGDKDLTNDKNINNGQNPDFVLGPFTQAGVKKIKIWAVSAAGVANGQEVEIEIYVPDIVISQVNSEKGTVSGYIIPAEPNMPFSLVRQRGSKNLSESLSQNLGNYQTDANGQFFIDDLKISNVLSLKNQKGESVAEMDEKTGKIISLKEGYSLIVDSATATLPNLIHVKDAQGNILISLFLVPASDSAGGSSGSVIIKDTNTVDAFEFKKSGNGASGNLTEIVYSNESIRTVTIENNGHISLLDSRMSLRVKSNAVTDPYVFELLFQKTVIGEITFATGDKPLEIVNGIQDVKTITTVSTVTSPASPSVPFADVPKNNPHYNAIQDLKNKGVIEGYQENGQAFYKPDQLISRAEYTKIVLKSLCIEPRIPEAYSPPSTFSDIYFTQPLEWFYPWVKESFLRDLITGYLGERAANGLAPFKPRNNISRAEAAKILLEALRMLKIIDFSFGPADPKIAPWYAPYMLAAQNLSTYLKKNVTRESFLVTPQEAKTPEKLISRGEFAEMASRVLQTYNCFADQNNTNNNSNQNISSNVSNGNGSDSVNSTNSATPPGSASAISFSRLTPGVYAVLPACNQCPCLSALEHTSDLLPGDLLFAVFAKKDLSVIYQKSNIMIIPPHS